MPQSPAFTRSTFAKVGSRPVVLISGLAVSLLISVSEPMWGLLNQNPSITHSDWLHKHLSSPSLRTQTYFRLSLVPPKTTFGGDNRQPEICLRSQFTRHLTHWWHHHLLISYMGQSIIALKHTFWWWWCHWRTYAYSNGVLQFCMCFLALYYCELRNVSY